MVDTTLDDLHLLLTAFNEVGETKKVEAEAILDAQSKLLYSMWDRSDTGCIQFVTTTPAGVELEAQLYREYFERTMFNTGMKTGVEELLRAISQKYRLEVLWAAVEETLLTMADG
jgi:hypothetical protein